MSAMKRLYEQNMFKNLKDQSANAIYERIPAWQRYVKKPKPVRKVK